MYYGTVAGADAYHLARGNAGWTGTNSEKEAALMRGSDYVDGRYRSHCGGVWSSLFSGTRTAGRAQPREWPRSGATDYEGSEIADDAIPIEVEFATYEAALRELLNPGSLSPDYVASQLVVKEKVGPIEVQYSDPSKNDNNPTRPVVTAIDEILAPLLVNCYGAGPYVMVV